MTTKFSYYDVGQLSRGQIVEVTLKGNAANVRLMDTTNYHNYKNGRRHTFIGGLVKKSPFQMQVPRSGHWHVTIDMNGLRGTAHHSVRVLPGPLPEARQTSPSSIRSLVRNSPPSLQPVEEPDPRVFDVFISHASEDKDELVRPLAKSLRDGGLDVWYDEYELRIGDSLRRKIDHGLARSRFGIVVLSDAFFAKGWPNYELDGLVTRAVSGEQILLPIWHNITKQKLIEYSPSLADKVARSTATHTIEEIASEIVEVIRGETVA